MNPVQVPDNSGKRVSASGIPMLLRVHARDTNGTVAVVESQDVPGGGPPPHIHHREDETFQILEGEYEWTGGGNGATIFALRGVPHMYRRLGQTSGNFMCVITPVDLEGNFEDIRARVAVCKDPRQPLDITRGMEIAKKFWLENLPPPAG